VYEDLLQCSHLLQSDQTHSIYSEQLIELVDHLNQFLTARQELIQIYKSFYHYLILDQLQEHLLELLAMVQKMLQYHVTKFTLPLLSPLKQIYEYELKCLWYAYCTEFYQNQLEIKEALMHLGELQDHLEAWQTERYQRKCISSQDTMTIMQEDLHTSWIRRMALYLTSKQAILFQRPLRSFLGKNDPFRLLLDKMVHYRSNVNISLCIIADGMENLQYVKENPASAVWLKSFILQAGYILPQTIHQEEIDNYSGLQLFPCLFVYPPNRSIPTEHWPNIISIIQELGRDPMLFHKRLEHQENPMKPSSYQLVSFHDSHARCVYSIYHVLSSSFSLQRRVSSGENENDDDSQNNGEHATTDPELALPSVYHPRPTIWGVLLIEAKKSSINQYPPSFWQDISRDTQLNHWMYQWIQLFRLSNLSKMSL
jgi:hypothetical protein